MSAANATTTTAIVSSLSLTRCGEGPENESSGTKKRVLKITNTAYKDKTTATYAATE
jgi:hypothetical protein